METCVLMPRDLSIILLPHPDPSKVLEMGVTLWANCTLRTGRVFRADEGTIRLDKLETFGVLPLRDVRYKFGCTDSIIQIDDREVRHCNWVRFLRAVHNPDEVNVIASRIQGQYLFQVVKTIPPNGELKAYFDLGPRIHRDEKLSSEITLPTHEKENLLISPTVSSIDSHSSSGSPRSDADFYDDRSTTLSSDVSPSSTNSSKPKESSSDFLSTPSSRGQKSTDDFSSTFASTPDEKQSSPSSLIGSPPEYGVSLMSSHPDYRDMRTLPLRRKEKTWLPCEVCGKKFDRPSLLKRHMRTHTGEKPHACDVCGKAFSTSSSLNTHRRIHSGEKPHQCQICGKRFTASSNLYYHRMTHKKEKPHKCSMCSKSFPTPGDLKSHMYVHNGSWPFKCDICNRGFSKQTNLKNHMLLHTGDKPHECVLCGKKFALQCNLRTHQKTHEDEPQDECQRCKRKFLTHKHSTQRGMCLDCVSPVSGDKLGNSRNVNSFSIESLVSPPSKCTPNKMHHLPHIQTTPIDMTKAPFYASAMMSAAGMLPMHPFSNGSSPFGMSMRWPPPPPISQRFGL